MAIEPAVAVIIVAAGSGTRLERPEPKAFVMVGRRSILEHALETVFSLSEAVQVIVVAPSAMVDDATVQATTIAGSAADYLTVVGGGDTRQQSVVAGLAQLGPAVEVVLVHDAARAFTPIEQFDVVIATVRATGGGVIPSLPVADTIKQIDWTGAVAA